MCILKIHSNSHTANAIQSAAHNMDTNISDLDTLKRLLKARGHVEESEKVGLAQFHMERQRAAMWEVWNGFIQDASASNDAAPIGVEGTHVGREHPTTFKHSKEFHAVESETWGY